MDSNQDSKRQRLDSWDSSATRQQQNAQYGQHAYQHTNFSPQSQYSPNSSMGSWDNKAQMQPGQHTISNSRTQSVGGGTPTGNSGHITPPMHYATPGRAPSLSINPHVTHGISSPISSVSQAFPGYHTNPDLDSPQSHAATQTQHPQSAQRQIQQLKPLQTAQNAMYTESFYTPPQHLPSSMTAELGSPGSAVTLPPGPSPMMATGGYPGSQASPINAASALAGTGAMNSPSIPTPVSAGPGGMILSGSQGMGVVTTYPPRRKAIRAAQACDACRARKAKCDEGRPSCGFCKESQVPCNYREVPPPKQDRTLQAILDRLGRVETLLDTMNTKTGETKEEPVRKKSRTATTSTPAEQPPSNVAQTSSTYQPVASSYASAGATPDQRPLPRPPTEIPLEEDDQLTIPQQHTTAAHKLLWWPSIRKMIDEELVTDENYVLEDEESRGSLNVYGKGERSRLEGEDISDDEQEDLGDMGFLPDHRRVQSRSSAASDWEKMREETLDGLLGEDKESKESGIGVGEALKLDQQTVLKLLNSYLANIHILHPILDRATIAKLIFKFVDRLTASSHVHSPSIHSANLPPGSVTESTTPKKGDVASRKGSMASGKRKRSASNAGVAQNRASTSTTIIPPKPRPYNIPRNFNSALVLLVLALGSVCLHKNPVPGPVPKMQPGTEYEFSTSPMQTSTPPLLNSASSIPSPYSQTFLGNAKQRRGPRNIDVIPGLGYFAKATEILGVLQGSNELEIVQAKLLAGLYWGQLGRVLDSWAWISMACMGCQILVRGFVVLHVDRTHNVSLTGLCYAFRKLHKESGGLRKDLILRAYWSCLQLESDILAELDVPPSGLSRLEDSMPLPSGTSMVSTDSQTNYKEDDPLMWMYYLAQIALRKLLNRVHTALYKQDQNHLDSPRSLAIAKELDYQLEQWKLHLPEPLQWEENDAPSTDINAARLRAKYFGARYIIHRPFIYHALHRAGSSTGLGHGNSPALSASEVSQQGSPHLPGSATAAAGQGRGFESRKLSTAGAGGDDMRVVDLSSPSLESSCRKCLDAAIQSTTAFGAFDPDVRRPVITNVFGTAHAHFGNLLVLQAAYQSTVLNGMIAPHVLNELLDKTKHWFQTLAPLSPALRRDISILENAASKLDFSLSQYQ